MNSRRKRRSFWKWLAAVGSGVSLIVVFACNSPFIPIPPPDPNFSQDSSSGDWAISMPADSNAIGAKYYIYNSTLGSGLIQKASSVDGSAYARPLQGQAGDHIYIRWEKGSENSSTICRPLGAGLVQMGCQ